MQLYVSTNNQSRFEVGPLPAILVRVADREDAPAFSE